NRNPQPHWHKRLIILLSPNSGALRARIEPTTTEVPAVGRRPRRQTRQSPRTHRRCRSCDSVRSGADLVPVPACVHVSSAHFPALVARHSFSATGGPTHIS